MQGKHPSEHFKCMHLNPSWQKNCFHFKVLGIDVHFAQAPKFCLFAKTISKSVCLYSQINTAQKKLLAFTYFSGFFVRLNKRARNCI